jgi:hypothetical protein
LLRHPTSAFAIAADIGLVSLAFTIASVYLKEKTDALARWADYLITAVKEKVFVAVSFCLK